MQTAVTVDVTIPEGLFLYDIGGLKITCTKCNGSDHPSIDQSKGMRIKTDFEEIFRNFIQKHIKCLGVTVPQKG